ncbi:hypothetical protein KC330_g9208 [Hortaea werneckii]|nr:hypothetical protein KC330_g9208 [Hortaea werneckii]
MPPIPKVPQPTILGVVPSTQGGLQAGVELLQEIRKWSLAESRSKTILVLPDFVLLANAAKLLHSTTVLLGAWDISVKDDKAEGGTPDAKTLSDAGVNIVDVTQNEEKIIRKTEEVVRSGMKPLICMQASVETSPSQQFCRAFENVLKQMKAVVGTIPRPRELVILWECKPHVENYTVEDVEGHIRRIMSLLQNERLVDGVNIDYGIVRRIQGVEDLKTE